MKNRNGNDQSVKRSTVMVLLAFAALILSGCASVMGLDTDPAKQAEAPTYRVGDRWVYHVEDGYRLPIVWDETHEVTAVGSEGVTVRITRKGPYINDIRTELWPQPGLVSQGALMSAETRVFKVPYVRYHFPMHAGDHWSQWLEADQGTARTGQPNISMRALGWEMKKTATGDVEALRLMELTLLDDEDPWRYATRGNYEIWYAPAVNNIIYAKKVASYREKGDRESSIEVPTQYEIIELRLYERGAP